ncbi:MAG TPA: PQQ-binding-like beta-propeller repeat protein [Pyrinomonadaceae bacterium]|nr:PQQ-binding-like beta-propeller repeat protein [Pyrinomonadaceae bacterium]
MTLAISKRRNQFYEFAVDFKGRLLYFNRRILVLLTVLILSGSLSVGSQVLKAVSTPIADKVSLSQPLTVRWRYVTNATLNLTPASDNARVYLPLAAGLIVSLNASDGQLYWKSEIGGEFTASPVADDKAVYVAAETTVAEAEHRSPKGSIRALGKEAGVTLWFRDLPVPIHGSLAMSANHIFAGTADGGFYSFDKVTGENNWFVQLGSPLNCTPTIAGDSVFVGDEDGQLTALEETTGKVRWRFHTNGPVRGPVSVTNGTVYLGSGDGYVYALGEADGRQHWRTRTGAGVQAVKSVSRGVLVASFDNFVYLLHFQKGKRLWKRQLPGRITAQPVTTEDGALFTPLAGDVAVVLAMRDGKQVNRLPTGTGTNTAASPLIVNDAVLLTTDQGLLAFTQPGKVNAASQR